MFFILLWFVYYLIAPLTFKYTTTCRFVMTSVWSTNAYAGRLHLKHPVRMTYFWFFPYIVNIIFLPTPTSMPYL